MNEKNFSWVRRLRQAPMLSPLGFVVRAGIITAIFVVCHALGWREHTTFLSGTSAAAGTSVSTSAVLGVIYMATWFGAVLATPILLLAAAILATAQRFARGQWTSLTRNANTP